MRLQPLGFRFTGSPSIQYLFFKKHEAPGGHQHGQPSAPALFVSGLPLHFGEQGLIQAFSSFGTVLQAVLHPSQRSGMVVLESSSAADAALQAARAAEILELPTPPSPPDSQPAGLKAWVAAHKAARPAPEQLQAQLDAWTEQHEEAEAAKLRAAQEAMADDGWTVVVRSKGRKRTKESGGVVRQSGGVAQAAAQAMAAARQVQEKPAEDFYKFQQREKRRNELMDLRKKFEEDRKRLQQMRAARNFRPV